MYTAMEQVIAYEFFSCFQIPLGDYLNKEKRVLTEFKADVSIGHLDICRVTSSVQSSLKQVQHALSEVKLCHAGSASTLQCGFGIEKENVSKLLRE